VGGTILTLKYENLSQKGEIIFLTNMVNTTKHIQITVKGLDALKEELKKLVEEKKPNLVKRLSRARGEGDLSENSDYQNAKEELEFLQGRIEELEKVISTAQIVDDAKNGELGIGTKVTVRINGSEHIFEIVGDWEADPVNKKISHTSPLGQALSGKNKGDKVEVEAPAGKVVYEIVSID